MLFIMDSFPLFILSLLLILTAAQTPIQERLIGRTLEGTWKQLSEKNPVPIFPIGHNQSIPLSKASFTPFFNVTESTAEGLFYEVASDTGVESWFFLRVKQGKYLDDRAIQISFPLLEGYDASANTWTVPETYYSAILFSRRKELIRFDLKAKLKLSMDKQILTPFTIPDQMVLELESDSIQIAATLAPVREGIHFFWLMLLINTVQLGLLLCFGRNQRVLFNTSEWLILQTICLFVLQSLFMVTLALTHYDTPLFYLIVTAVMNILVLLLLLAKFEAVIEKFKNSSTMKLVALFVTSYFIGVLQFGNYAQFWVIEGMIFIWQIVHSMKNGGSGGVSLELVAVVALSRVPLMCTLGLEDNVYRMEPDKMATKIIFLTMLFHLVLIGLQRKLGSRLFVPKFMIPDFYEYRRTDLSNSENANQDCSICLNKLRESPEHFNETDEAIEVGPKALERVAFAVTPCKHFFHLKCLSDWLQTNLTCPNCKRGAPPMGEAA